MITHRLLIDVIHDHPLVIPGYLNRVLTVLNITAFQANHFHFVQLWDIKTVHCE